MGVKSTVTLTRTRAIERIVDLKLQIQMEEVRKTLADQVDILSDSDIEDMLEDLADEAAEARGSTNFDNFSIKD